MTRAEAKYYEKQLTDLYLKLENDICKDTRYDCRNCVFGILISEDNSYSCSVEAVQDALFSKYNGV